jgi:AraC-like DNA-binding protein
MYAEATYHSNDPVTHAAAIDGARLEFLRVGGGDFRGRVTHVAFDRVKVVRGEESLPVIVRSKVPAGRLVAVMIRPGSAPAMRCGNEITSRQIVLAGAGSTVSWRTTGAGQWGAISFAVDDFLRIGRDLLGRNLVPPAAQLVLTPPAPQIARLQRVHDTICRMSETNPRAIFMPDEAAELERKLLHAFLACVRGTDGRETKASRQHGQVLARFEALLEAYPHRPPDMAEICTTIGVPGRTLRHCCAHHFGISPKQYLMIRRLHSARRALLLATPAPGQIARIATRFGFFELGRFSVAYRELFGELPSATLQHAPQWPATTPLAHAA